jgi:uncharacterized membrane protein YeaQ/YmgE (transglycosylase-associated protein family)
MLNLILWILFGALVGWLASLITGRNERMGCLANIVVGILGALVGGFIVDVLLPGNQGVSAGFNLWSILVALLGAVVVLLVFGWFRGRR